MAGVKPRVKLLALAIPYSWNPNEQLGNDFFLAHFNINKWSVLGRGSTGYVIILFILLSVYLVFMSA